MLSCDCGWGDHDWYYSIEEEPRIAVTPFRCYGCCKPKPMLEEVRLIEEITLDEDGEEEGTAILGRLCSECSDLYDSLTELGFCLTADWGFVAEAMIQYRRKDW